MKANRRLFAAAATLLAVNTWAAGYPDRPVQIIVPFTLGSGTDIVARAMGAALSKRMGVPVAVENMPGADGATGTAAVVKAKPDGHTLLVTTNSLTIAPHLRKTPPYDPDKDIVAVARIAVIPLVLVAGGKSSFKTFDDLVAGMRKEPGKVRYATLGRGSLSRLEIELMNLHFQVQAQAKPYTRAVDAIKATTGGEADFFLANFPVAQGQLKAGALRALAVSSGARMPAMPDVPTLAEVMGRPTYEATVWFGLLAPAGTASQVITRLENEVSYELEAPEVGTKIESVGGRAAFLRSAPFGAQVRGEYRKWGQVAKARQ